MHLLPGLLLVLSTNLTYLWGGFRVEGRGAWWFGPMLFGVWVWGVVVYYFPLVLNYVPVPNRRLAGEPARTVLVKCRRLLEELLFAGRCITLASLEAFALIVWLKALTGGDVADMSHTSFAAGVILLAIAHYTYEVLVRWRSRTRRPGQ